MKLFLIPKSVLKINKLLKQKTQSPCFDKLKTFMKQNNSIIIAGDKYNNTPRINQSFNDTVGDITLREKSIFGSVIENSTLYDKTLCPQEHSEELFNTTSHPTENFNFSNQAVIQSHQSSHQSNNQIFTPFQKRY